MKRSGFTMIELIFVIVILGILAAVAIPKLAATREDAQIAAAKATVVTAASALPAWFQGQKEAALSKAMAIDLATWVPDSTNEKYVYTVSGDTNPCITLAVYDMNDTAAGSIVTSANAADYTTTYTYAPTLRIIKGDGSNTGSGTVCTSIWKSLEEQNITLGGRSIR